MTRSGDQVGEGCSLVAFPSNRRPPTSTTGTARMPFATRMTGRRVTSTSCKLKLIFSAYADQAIDQGYRAVQELLIELTPKICRDCQ
jgi:hypothetical protein